jgi:SAM-dependent methyltransferase
MLTQESEIYDRAKVDVETGEIEEFDTVIFNGVIRPREVGFVSRALKSRNGMRVLDLGCGGGWMTRTLIHMGHDAIGVDVSRGILLTASTAAETKGRLIRADGHSLPFREGAFDAVVCVGALHHTDLKRLLPGLERIVKRDGVLVFLEPNKFNPFSAIGRRLFPMSTHTPGEEPYGPRQLRVELSSKGWRVEEYQSLFLYALALSYVLHKLNWPRAASKVVGLVDRHERRMERWFSIVPVGAVILGTARPRAPLTAAGGGRQ